MERLMWTDERLTERFDRIDQRFDQMDRRFDRLESKMDEGFRELHRLMHMTLLGMVATLSATLVAVATRAF